MSSIFIPNLLLFNF